MNYIHRSGSPVVLGKRYHSAAVVNPQCAAGFVDFDYVEGFVVDHILMSSAVEDYPSGAGIEGSALVVLVSTEGNVMDSG